MPSVPPSHNDSQHSHHTPPGGGPAIVARGTRTVHSLAGTCEIPVSPRLLVALDEPAALNLLSIGITPDLAYASWQTTIPRRIIEAQGVEVRDSDTETPALETVAELNPDLLVITGAPGLTDEVPQYASIAPLVAGSYALPGPALLRTFGELFDRAEVAAALAEKLTVMAAANALAQEGGEPSLSVLLYQLEHQMSLYMDSSNPLHSAIAASGFQRPFLQDTVPAGGTEYVGWSSFEASHLAEHDADLLAVAVAQQYGADGIRGLPGYSELDAVRQNRAFAVDGDFWSGGAAFYSYWVLTDLAHFIRGELIPGDVSDALARWTSFGAAQVRP